MENQSIILNKSFAFAVRIIRLSQYLKKDYQEYDLARQILKSGTSIGANAEEAEGGFSKKDFAAKMGIAYKEARETKYWLRLLHATNYIDIKLFNSLFDDCEEILKILFTIIKKTRQNPEK